MRKSLRFIAFFSALVLLFCNVFVLCASDNDARFDNYINMGQKGAENNYAIPHLFRQDAPYGYMDSFPLVVKDGVEYVPLSMFILYSYVDVNYSYTNDNFFLVNNRNNHYVSFDVANALASTHDGDLLRMNTYIFNKIRYVPARTVSIILGFVCESYDDPVKGIYSFRISDGRSSKTLEDLLEAYLPKQEEPPVEEDDVPPEVPVEAEDPIEKIAPRNVGLCFVGFNTGNDEELLKTLEAYRIKAAFSLERQEILNKPSLVRGAYVLGHNILLTAKAYGETPREYAQSFIKGLNDANEALRLVLKRKTRMCTLPYGIPQEIKDSREFQDELYNAGYLVIEPETKTEDTPSYKGSAYTVSRQIKSQVTDGYDRNTEANLSALIYTKPNTVYTVADIALLIKKYAQFKFFAIDETYLYNS